MSVKLFLPISKMKFPEIADIAMSAIETKLGIDASRKLAGEGHKRGWRPLIQIDGDTCKKIETLFGELA